MCSIKTRMSPVGSLIFCSLKGDPVKWGEIPVLRTVISGNRRSAGRSRFGYDFANPIRHPGALGYPVVDALALELNAGRAGARIVSPDHLDRTAIARAFLFDDHDAIMRLFSRTRARQTNH